MYIMKYMAERTVNVNGKYVLDPMSIMENFSAIFSLSNSFIISFSVGSI